MTVIVDACVGIKWFIIEELRPEAMRLQTIFSRLAVPEFFVLEIADIAFKKVQSQELPESSAVRIIPWLRQSGLNIDGSTELMDRALEIALEIGHPVYDCIYAALAESHGGVVVSHDQAFLKRLAASRFAAFAHPLHDVDVLIGRYS